MNHVLDPRVLFSPLTEESFYCHTGLSFHIQLLFAFSQGK